MKTFVMHRGRDESNISGTGNVLSGCIFPSGTVVVEWHSKTNVNSLGVYKNYFDFYFIHCHSHPTNNTHVLFDDADTEPVVRERARVCKICKNEYSEHPRDLQGDTETKLRRSCAGKLVKLRENI